MAIDRTVLFEGIPYYIVGEAIIETPFNEHSSLFTVAVAINRIEPATAQGIARAIWLPREQVVQLVSSLDYTKSEWYLGVSDGNKR